MRRTLASEFKAKIRMSPEPARLFEQADVPGMKQIVAAVGEDDRLAARASREPAVPPIPRDYRIDPLPPV